MDSNGAYAHYKYAGELADQPDIDMQIFDVIKSKWCELRNAETKASMEAIR